MTLVTFLEEAPSAAPLESAGRCSPVARDYLEVNNERTFQRTTGLAAVMRARHPLFVSSSFRGGGARVGTGRRRRLGSRLSIDFAAVGIDSHALSGPFVVEHPAFGKVTFAFDDAGGDSGFAATEGFVYFSIRYPGFSFSFRRMGDVFVASELNDLTRQQYHGHWRTISEIAPPAFRSFVLSKAKQLAQRAGCLESRTEPKIPRRADIRDLLET
jgi:hypothetical protein